VCADNGAGGGEGHHPLVSSGRRPRGWTEEENAAARRRRGELRTNMRSSVPLHLYCFAFYFACTYLHIRRYILYFISLLYSLTPCNAALDIQVHLYSLKYLLHVFYLGAYLFVAFVLLSYLNSMEACFCHRIKHFKRYLALYLTLSLYFSELRDIKSELRDIKSELCVIKSELRDIKSEMRDIKSELRDIKSEL